MIYSHNHMNDEAKQGDFLGQEKLILGHIKMNYGMGTGEVDIES